MNTIGRFVSSRQVFSYQKIFFEFLFQNDKQIDGNNLNSMTETGLEKKVRHRTVCPLEDISLRAPFTQLLVFRNKLKRENSHDPQATHSPASFN